MNLLLDFLTALQFLTRIPIPALPWDEHSLARAAKFFPAVGLLVGALAALAHYLLAPHLPRLATATLTVLALVLLTGALHEDALADTADGFGGGHTRDQILAILRDSRIGSYGGTALALSFAARISLLASIPLPLVTPCLLAAHVLCRWTTLPLAFFVRPARPPGDGQATHLSISAATLAFGTAFTLVVCGLLLHLRSLPALLLACALTTLSGLFYRRRIGGVTGDCFGATSQLTEVATYLVGAWALHA